MRNCHWQVAVFHKRRTEEHGGRCDDRGGDESLCFAANPRCVRATAMRSCLLPV
jgi:hypothetical protein